MEDSRKISSRNIVSHRLFGGNDPAEYCLENGMEAENPGVFLSDQELCENGYFGHSISYGGSAAQRRICGTFVSMRFYCIWRAFGSYVYTDPGTGNGSDTYFVCAGILALWGTCRSRTSVSSVCDLCSCLFLAGRSCVQAVFWNLEKLWSGACKKRALRKTGDGGSDIVFRRDSGGELSESMDR